MALGAAAVFRKSFVARTLRSLTSILIIAGMFVATVAVADNAESSDVIAAFVVLGESSSGEVAPMARVIVHAGVACPVLRAKTGGNTVEVEMAPRINPAPEHFPVTVCESRYPFSQSLTVGNSALELPAVSLQWKEFLVLGDSGCKARNKSPVKACSPERWPFEALASQAAENLSPDLILHVGDYNYRGTPGRIPFQGEDRKKRVYDAWGRVVNGKCVLKTDYVSQNAPDSQLPDQWAYWWQDFFQPAQPLLQTAPWVFTRGNHELCSRSGPGWFYLLSPESMLLGDGKRQLSCPSSDATVPQMFSPPYRLSGSGLSLYVLDSANACDEGSLFQPRYDSQFGDIYRQLQTDDNARAWLISHRPLWGLRKPDIASLCERANGKGEFGCLNRTLQLANLKYNLNPLIDLVFSGHMHRFQSTTLSREQLTQIVVGNSGVALAKNIPAELYVVELEGMRASGTGISEFGFLKVDVGADSWSAELFGLAATGQDQILMRCSAAQADAGMPCDRLH